MEYKYFLPDSNNNKIEYKTSNNSLVIIGANGAGKSKLGAWMEEQSLADVHRVRSSKIFEF